MSIIIKGGQVLFWLSCSVFKYYIFLLIFTIWPFMNEVALIRMCYHHLTQKV